MTPAGMACLRIAATLVHVLPSLRVRLRHGDRMLLEVAARPRSAHPSVRTVDACVFRQSVARAHQRSRQGVRLRFMDLPEGTEPAIDVGVGPGALLLPGGIYRAAIGTETIEGFATTLPPGRCRTRLADLDDVGAPVRLHHDAVTEVTFVHTVAAGIRLTPDGPSALEGALAALVGEEVDHELARSC